MKKKYIIGNWKSNKTVNEVEKWFEALEKLIPTQVNLVSPELEIILCPSLVHLFLAKKLAENLPFPLKIAAQDVSPFQMGAYTGEVNIIQLKEAVDYVLVGHSERRKYFREDDQMRKKKVEQIISADIQPIFCVSDSATDIPIEVRIVAYEPVFAIGTGQADTPENADKVASLIRQKNKNAEIIIYGGSVNQDNIARFLTQINIDGVLPGGASLDAKNYWEMIVNASKP